MAATGTGSATTRRGDPLRKLYFGDIYKEGKYEPLHRELFDPDAPGRWTSRRWLADSFDKVAGAARAGDPRPALRQDAPGVYSFELFSPEFCDMLVEEVEHAQRTRREDLDRPNGMNRYGVVLNQMGLEPIITALQQTHLLPLQEALFPEVVGADDHHCFIVRYKAGEDVGLDMHEDDSDVTLNVCLGKEFTAATLSFCGKAADQDHRKLQHTYEHCKGRAVVHVGRHRHGADNIESGERVNFILWSVSSGYRASEEYKLHRLRSTTALDPDPICLSYTHDRDYTKHLRKPTREEAITRGVMLNVVERRHEQYNRPVHDLSKPIEEINSVPSVCVFLDGLLPQTQRELFRELMLLASEVQAAQSAESEGSGPSRPGSYSTEPLAPSLLFFVAVQASGAVPQVKDMCGIRGSPDLAVLDIDKACVYRRAPGQEVTGDSMREFVDAFLKGTLPKHSLNDAEKEEEGTSNTDDGMGAAQADPRDGVD